MRYSGHEWFPCRYAWLPKAVRALADDPGALRDTEGAVERLGIGKNMVRALVFWATAMGVIESSGGGHAVTQLYQSAHAVDKIWCVPVRHN